MNSPIEGDRLIGGTCSRLKINLSGCLWLRVMKKIKPSANILQTALFTEKIFLFYHL